MTRPLIFVILQTGSLANGGVRSIGEVMTRLKDYRPVALTNLDTEMSQGWRAAGVEVHVVGEMASTHAVRHNPLGVLKSYGRYAGALSRLIASSGARVIHANDPLAFQLSLPAAKYRRARITLNLRGTMDPARRPPGLKYQAIFAASDHVFYLSEEMAEWWRRNVAANATRASSVTYSIVDRDRFYPAPLPHAGPRAVLVSGVFSEGKGQLEFIREVVPSLAAAGIEVWFAGDFDSSTDPYAAACAAAALPFKDHCRFLGYRTDLPDLIRRAIAVAVPSRHEGLMRGMIEAMSCGQPVVSFDVCSAREILECKSAGSGAVLRLGDYEGMAGALIHYATNESAREAAGHAGSDAARELFDPDRVVERYERVYRELDDR